MLFLTPWKLGWWACSVICFEKIHPGSTGENRTTWALYNNTVIVPSCPDIFLSGGWEWIYVSFYIGMGVWWQVCYRPVPWCVHEFVFRNSCSWLHVEWVTQCGAQLCGECVLVETWIEWIDECTNLERMVDNGEPQGLKVLQYIHKALWQFKPSLCCLLVYTASIRMHSTPKMRRFSVFVVLINTKNDSSDRCRIREKEDWICFFSRFSNIAAEYGKKRIG